MLIKSTHACAPFIANDGCRIREVLHPSQDPVALPYSLAFAEVDPGGSTFRHRLRQDEVYYLLEGEGRMHVDASARTVAAGDVVHIPGGAVQWIENVGVQTLRFLALVSPPWTATDDERL